MALSKPRKITIDGTLYHWKASRNGSLHFAVREPKSPKMRMVVYFQEDVEVPITPGLIRKYIKRAITDGWDGSIRYDHELDSGK